ncbi:hypothetical protein HDV05_000758 [Chytridiales sp. JEL 0842]|nr:hypothetical protein HDV05_000758 [Chytridiales sp. JEL 0842]
MTDDMIDHNIFDQLLEMDDDEVEREFSKGIVLNYFEQAETTFADMNTGIANADLGALSRLGHYLKGSSAALGLIKVRLSCEKIQYYGALKDETGAGSIGEQEALERIRATLMQALAEYREAEAYLKSFFKIA